MQSPAAWVPSGFDDETEINSVDLATRENSNPSQLLLREERESKEAGDQVPAGLLPGDPRD